MSRWASTTAVALIALLALAAPARAACDPEDKPDKTTATDTKKKLEAAGFRQVADLKKGCDNVWHGSAVGKDGAKVGVIVSPQGQIMLETNP